MINLGPYSGKNCLMSVFNPLCLTVFWKGTALLIVLVTWISILIVLFTTYPSFLIFICCYKSAITY